MTCYGSAEPGDKKINHDVATPLNLQWSAQKLGLFGSRKKVLPSHSEGPLRMPEPTSSLM